MNTLTVDGWYRPAGADKPIHMELLRFRVSDEYHLLLENAEEELLDADGGERLIPVDMDSLELEIPAECGPLEDCQLRIYLSPIDHRGHFHLVGHRANDHGLVYSNAVMVDQLG